MSVLKRHSHLIIRCLQGTRRYNSEGRVYGGLLQAQYVCGMWLAEDIVSVLGLFDYLYAMYSLIRKRKCKKEMYFVMEIRKGRSELRVNKCSKSGRVGTGHPRQSSQEVIITIHFHAETSAYQPKLLSASRPSHRTSYALPLTRPHHTSFHDS